MDIAGRHIRVVDDETTPAELRCLVRDHFNESELRDFCFDLSIDYEVLAGPAKGDKARELVAYCQRHGRLSKLVTAFCQARPRLCTDQMAGTVVRLQLFEAEAAGVGVTREWR
jgi:hypothetical protein